MRRALDIEEKSLGPDHPNLGIRLNNLAAQFQLTNRLTEAEALTAALSQFSRRPSAPSIRPSRQPSITWRCCFKLRNGFLTPGRFIAEHLRLMRRASDLITQMWAGTSATLQVCFTPQGSLLRPSRFFAEH